LISLYLDGTIKKIMLKSSDKYKRFDKMVKRELTIFVGIFLFLAIGMHFKVWISHPIDHIMTLASGGIDDLGTYHPLIFTLAAYLIILPFRGIAKLFKKENKE